MLAIREDFPLSSHRPEHSSLSQNHTDESGKTINKNFSSANAFVEVLTQEKRVSKCDRNLQSEQQRQCELEFQENDIVSSQKKKTEKDLQKQFIILWRQNIMGTVK